MKLWLSRLIPWLVVIVAFSALSIAVYAFGLYVVPSLVPLDQAVSETLNPDEYVPVVDEFFRAFTDYAIPVIAVPLISLAVATYAFRLSMLSRRRALGRAAIACLIGWLALGILYGFGYLPIAAVYILGAFPLLVAIGAGPRLILDHENARHWIVALLVIETVAFAALWAFKALGWNDGLMGANFMFLAALLISFALVIRRFLQMDIPAAMRFQKVFLLILLTVMLVGFVATNYSKEHVGRPRPLSDMNAPWNEALRYIPEEKLTGTNSYPSGHVSGTFSLITPLFWAARRRKTKAGLMAVGVVQAWSRIYTAAHFLSDTLIGAALGFGTGTLIFFLLGGVRLHIPDTETMLHPSTPSET